MNKEDKKDVIEEYEKAIKDVERKMFMQSIIKLVFLLILITLTFYAIKWSVIQVFMIWGINLTASQSTALAFLLYCFYNGLSYSNKKGE